MQNIFHNNSVIEKENYENKMSPIAEVDQSSNTTKANISQTKEEFKDFILVDDSNSEKRKKSLNIKKSQFARASADKISETSGSFSSHTRIGGSFFVYK